ncbi:Protein fmp52, mitochondrial [Pleurotus pulmonarius]|nr:Protein fmp52, mitochondrial [Pleurotus pulmonarius]KAF4594103.1 Protein fmp52, mitochondrial [Pleurotus pulmonarius]
MSGSKSALLIGATGQVGRRLLQQLLSCSEFCRVGEYGRNVTPMDRITVGKEKLEQKVIDFDNLKRSEWKDQSWDVIFVTLGTKRAKAGSASAFEKIDREYVLNAAKAALSEDPSHKQRIVYCSAMLANSQSAMLYTRSKGLTEEGLASLGYSDTITIRPTFLKGATREEWKLGETIGGYVMGFLSRFSENMEIELSLLAKSMIIAGVAGSLALPAAAEAIRVGPPDASYTVITNRGAIHLAKA